MAISTRKANLIKRYLAACTYFDVEPDAKYKTWTIAQLDSNVEHFATKFRAQKVAATATTIAKNTAAAARTVKQRAGETRRSVMQRAKDLAKGAKFPSIKISWS